MEKWLTTIIVLFTVIALAFGQQVKQWSGVNSDVAKEQSAPFSGVWEAYFRSDTVSMMLTHRHPDGRGQWVMSEDYLLTQFSELDPQALSLHFMMVRPAGSIRFSGNREGQTGYGRYTFEPNASFINALKKFGIAEPSNEILLHCFQANMKEDFLSFLKKEFPNINEEQLMEIAVFKVDQETVASYKSMGKLVNVKKLDIGQLIELQMANVSPEQVKGYVDAGLKGLNLENITNMSIHNIDPDYVKSMVMAGLKDLNVDKVIEASLHGVMPEEVAQYSASKSSKTMQLDDLIAAKVHQVSPEYAQQMRAAGLDIEDDSELIGLKIHGVSPDYVRQMQQAGLGKFSVDDLMALKVQGITPAVIAEYKASGFSRLSVDDVINMHLHGISGPYIALCNQLDPERIFVDDVINLKIHGVDKERIEGFKKAGFAKPGVDELIAAVIAGVTPEYIRQQMNRGIKKSSLQGYVDLKTMEGE